MPDKSWSDNREPDLMALLDDVVMQAVMSRDGVSRDDVLTLVARFRSVSGADDLRPTPTRSNTLPRSRIDLPTSALIAGDTLATVCAAPEVEGQAA